MSALGNIQQQIADLLAADSFFSYLTIHTEAVGRIADAMAKALGPVTGDTGKAGGFVCVMTPDANVNFPNLPGPFFDDISVVVQVTTAPEIAADTDIGIGVTDLDICENVCRVLQQSYPAGANAPLVAVRPTIQLLARGRVEEEGPELSTRSCSFKTMGGIRAVPTQVATPTLFITEGGQYQLSTSSPGAAVFYTLDGSNPVPVNVGNAQSPKTFLYITGFTPSTGLTLKARAFLAGLLNSETFTVST